MLEKISEARIGNHHCADYNGFAGKDASVTKGVMKCLWSWVIRYLVDRILVS